MKSFLKKYSTQAKLSVSISLLHQEMLHQEVFRGDWVNPQATQDYITEHQSCSDREQELVRQTK